MATTASYGSRMSPLPPPVPPLPSSRDLLSLDTTFGDTIDFSNMNSYNGQSQPQIRQIYSSTIMISKTVYDTDANTAVDASSSRLQSASPYNSLARSQTTSQYSTLDQTRTSSEYGTQSRYSMSPTPFLDQRHTGLAASPSIVSGNLSELDTLLDDLNESTRLYSSLSRERKTTMRSPSPVLASTSSLNYNSKPTSPQRELDIPKLSTLVRSSPTPSSGNDVMRSRPLRSPALQPQTSSTASSEPLLKIYSRQPVEQPAAGGIDPQLGRTAQLPHNTYYTEQQYVVQNYNQTPSFEADLSPNNSLQRQPTNYGSLATSPTSYDNQMTKGGFAFEGPSHYGGSEAGGRHPRSHQDQQPVDEWNDPEFVKPVQSAAFQSGPPPSGAAPGSAANDLEDLMASLSAFDKAAAKDEGDVFDALYAQPNKVKQTTPGDGGNDSHHHLVPNPVQQGSTISPRMVGGGQMHGELTGDVDENGLPLLPQGDCASCSQPITGPVLMALGRLWHVPHFLCAHCKQELGTSIFYERDGLPYCEADYQNLFLPRCADCGGVIIENCITAFNHTWHVEHFRCTECDTPFNDEKYYEKDGRPFCGRDYFRLYAPTCAGCGKAILNSYITALQQNWHSECFVCNECQLPFDNSGFYEWKGHMYCERHFNAQRGSTCAVCNQPVVGRCVTALYKKYHPEHFVCSFCMQPLNKGTFKEQNEKPYCHPCFNKLFG